MKNTKHLILAKGAFLMVLYDNMPRIVVAYITKSQTEKIRIMEKMFMAKRILMAVLKRVQRKLTLKKSKRNRT